MEAVSDGEPKSMSSENLQRAGEMAVRTTDFTHKDILSGQWMVYAECKDSSPDTFFPSDSAGVIEAIKICRKCLVQPECLEFALAYQIEHGVWGGTSVRERKRMHKRRLRTSYDQNS